MKIDFTVLGFGILCLIGGAALAYFGHFAPPYLLIPIGYPASAWILLVPFFLIFLGVAGIYGGIRNKPTSEEKKRAKEAPSLSIPPPPPPSSAAAIMCPTCGQPLTFMQQYGRWYCTNCKKYL